MAAGGNRIPRTVPLKYTSSHLQARTRPGSDVTRHVAGVQANVPAGFEVRESINAALEQREVPGVHEQRAVYDAGAQGASQEAKVAKAGVADDGHGTAEREILKCEDASPNVGLRNPYPKTGEGGRTRKHRHEKYGPRCN